MSSNPWIDTLAKDMDDVLARAIGVSLGDSPRTAQTLLMIIEDTSQSDRIRRNAAYALEALPPEPGVIQPWPEKEAVSIVGRLLGVLAPERASPEISSACLSAALAVIHHSFPTGDFRKVVMRRLDGLRGKIQGIDAADLDRAIRIIGAPSNEQRPARATGLSPLGHRGQSPKLPGGVKLAIAFGFGFVIGKLTPPSAPVPIDILAESENLYQEGKFESAAVGFEYWLERELERVPETIDKQLLSKIALRAVTAREKLLQFDRTVRPLEAVLERNVLPEKDLPGAYTKLGWASLASGKLERSRQAFEEARKLDPRAALPLLGLAELSLFLGEADKAVELALEAAKIAPANLTEQASSRLRRAIRAIAGANPTLAHKILEKSSGEGPLKNEVEYLKVLVLQEAKRYTEALAAADRQIKVDPRSVKLQFLRGVVLNDMGEGQKALAAYEAVLSIDPGNIDARINSGSLLAYMGQRDSGIARLEAALKDAPDDPRIPRALEHVKLLPEVVPSQSVPSDSDIVIRPGPEGPPGPVVADTLPAT